MPQRTSSADAEDRHKAESSEKWSLVLIKSSYRHIINKRSNPDVSSVRFKNAIKIIVSNYSESK
mgnify:CR=1 FL=1